VATTSRLLEIIGLFCKRALQNRRYSAKETYHSSDDFEVLKRDSDDCAEKARLLSCCYYLPCTRTLKHNKDPENYRSLLQKSPIKETIFCRVRHSEIQTIVLKKQDF